MGVELAISIEERFALQGSLTASATGLTVSELGEQIIGMSEDTDAGATNVMAAVAERHLGKADFDLLSNLVGQIEAQQRDG